MNKWKRNEGQSNVKRLQSVQKFRCQSFFSENSPICLLVNIRLNYIGAGHLSRYYLEPGGMEGRVGHGWLVVTYRNKCPAPEIDTRQV